MKYKIDKQNVGQRIDKFLAKKMPKFSRSQIQKNIKSGLITVNDKNINTRYPLKEGEIIEIRNKKLEIKYFKNLKFKILKDNDDYLIINKPVGMLVHPVKLSSAGFNMANTDKIHNEITVSDWLVKKYSQVKSVWDKQNKTGKIRPGIVHRLDRDVSGVLVLAKTQLMFNHLKAQFKNRKIYKEYITLVHGQIEPDSGIIKRPMSRSKKSGLMVARTDESDLNSKEAITQFEVLKRFRNYTLLKINIKTGRTHQIRVHLKSIGHSVVGDSLHQTRDVKLKKVKYNLDRIFLCATKLGFEDLDGKWVEVEIKLPNELKDYLKVIK